MPPLVFAGEARRLKTLLGDVAGGQGLPAAGRRLRRELQGIPRRQHPRHLPPDPADGGGADLRRRQAGGEGGPHRRPVRQAALGADRDDRRRRPCRPIGATTSTAWSSRPRIAIPDPERLLQRLRPVGRDAEPAARLRQRRLCRPATTSTAGRWASWPTARRARATASCRTRSARALTFMSAIGVTPESQPDPAPGGVLHQPRGPAAGLRGSHDPRRFHLGRLVRHLAPTCCGSASAPASWTARTSSSCAASRTRSASSAARPWKRDDLLRLIDALNPQNEPGRLTLYGRFGSDKIADRLPRLMKRHQGRRPLRWSGPSTRCTATR